VSVSTSSISREMIAVSVSASSISREMMAVTVSPPYLCFSVSNFSVSSLQDIFSVILMPSALSVWVE
jgi:hypothetical protein